MTACPAPVTTKLAEPPDYRFHKVVSMSFSCLERGKRARETGSAANQLVP